MPFPSAKRRSSPAAALLLLTIITHSVQGELLTFGDAGLHVIDGRDYDAHNIFVVNGTTLTLQTGHITAPASGDDGEDAVRIEDATFSASSGIIRGGVGIGGTGVTISTTRDSAYPPGTATFEAGVEVYGGDATREKTTKGGDAVQVLHAGSRAVINGGKFVPGTGCTIQGCGTATSDGNALQVLQGEAIIKGGSIEGVLFNSKGNIELHGCVEYDADAKKVVGVLLDGSNIDAVYEGNGSPGIVYHPEMCPPEAPLSTPQNGGRKVIISIGVVLCAFIALGWH